MATKTLPKADQKTPGEVIAASSTEKQNDAKAEKKTPGEVIKNLEVGRFVRLQKITGAGTLEARRLAAGVMLYWRWTHQGKADRVVIGNYDPKAPPQKATPTSRGFGIEAAVAVAEALAKQHTDNLDKGGYRGVIEAQAKAQAEQVAAAEAHQQQLALAAEQAAQYTLQAMLSDYCDHLEKLERRSHRDARSIFRIHVVEAWPAIAALPANQVTAEQIADMMRRTLEGGKGRTANKLRSYVRAAYQTALAARSKASVPLRFKAYKVTLNPAASTVPDEGSNTPDKNPLSLDDLRLYWGAIADLPGFTGAVLRLHLLTGGQRIEQLVALRTANIGEGTITLFDGKGRPGKPPRPHTVPLTPLALAALAECRAVAEQKVAQGAEKPGLESVVVDDQNPKLEQGQFALSTDHGQTHLASTTLSRSAVVAAATVPIPGFATKRLRSGIETALAAARISADHRGRLQSHGVSGVQARHYDGHHYIDEKRHALDVLENLLTGADEVAGNVRPFRAA